MSVLIAVPSVNFKTLEQVQNNEKIERHVDDEFGDFFGELEKAKEVFRQATQSIFL